MADRFISVAFACLLFCGIPCLAQAVGTLHGHVTDPSGAVIPNATVTVSIAGRVIATSRSDKTGAYTVRGLPPDSYGVAVSSTGFAPFQTANVRVAAGENLSLNAALAIKEAQQQVTVTDQEGGVGTNPDSNSNAVQLQGRDLDTLSDDPDEMLDQLEALAGPSAGPNGAEIYVDGFSGGQLPPKSSIREIRINENPFSAEYDRLGYGRIEILTRPGTDHLHGQLGARGNDASFNARDPLLAGPQPPYDSYDVNGSLSGPIGKGASYFLSVFSRSHGNISVVDAIDPASVMASTPDGSALSQSVDSPDYRLDTDARIDLQLGRSNTISVRNDLYRAGSSNQGVGEFDLASQAYDSRSLEDDLELRDSFPIGARFVDNLGFAFRSIRNRQSPLDATPTVTVQGAFTGGGSNSGAVTDHQDDFELNDTVSAAIRNHSLNFGGRLRVYDDRNETDAGSNGAYIFSSLASYLDKTPQIYAVTTVKNPLARLVLFDAALFYQDDWKATPRLDLSYGLRWESQNRIHDKSDWAPRLSLAYAIGPHGAAKPRTVLRIGYGWFYQRFTVPNSLDAVSGTPYLATAIHQNGINQVSYTVTDPSGYQETAPGVAVQPPTPSSSSSAPTLYSVARNFHAALDMQAAVGVDRQFAKGFTTNITYLYARGVHQYLTNNIGAAPFSTAALGIYPDKAIPAASRNLLQYQSGGVYRENELILTASLHRSRYSLFGFYTYSNARSDTTGVTYTPSVAQDPGFDYGRSSFDIHHRVVAAGNLFLPDAIALSPMFVYNSGTPYNITAGADLTGNNQFNARPAYASQQQCAAGGQYVETPYGCLDADPIGTQEKVIPYGLGTGPANVALNLRFSKVIGIGPRIAETGGGSGGPPPGGPRGGGPGGLGPGGLSANHSGPEPGDASTPRRYSLTFSAMGANILNHQNLSTPNGVLTAPASLRFHSQALASGPFRPPEGGNRSIFLEAHFNF